MTTISVPGTPLGALEGQVARAQSGDPGRYYMGERCGGGCRVVVVDAACARPLMARTRDPLWSFCWGRQSASARELAWAMLYDSTGDGAVADDWCGAFSTEVIATLPHDRFGLAVSGVLAWLECDAALPHDRLGVSVSGVLAGLECDQTPVEVQKTLHRTPRRPSLLTQPAEYLHPIATRKRAGNDRHTSV
jgi:hypothetical protein